MKIGLDIGSTTLKAVILDENGTIIYKQYKRHLSLILQSALDMLKEISACLPSGAPVHFAISGSAGMGLAAEAGLPFVQEVYATRVRIEKCLPQTDVAIELGGEDAKILFFQKPVDARMNGSCAGGTGAFIDQMATLLKLTPEELNQKARGQQKIYPIASRCGVFAKSDVQPLLNQGARVEDVASSVLYSVVNQTVAGLAQGRAIEGNIVYLGGPLTFLSELRAAFDHVLNVKGTLPTDSLYFVAAGAALCADEVHTLDEIAARLQKAAGLSAYTHTQPLFESEAEYTRFKARHDAAVVPTRSANGYRGRAHLGIDAGSTTIKTALISEEGELLLTSYRQNTGNPVPYIKEELLRIYTENPRLILGSVTVTGYGEQLVLEAFNADFGVVETVAHFLAAKTFKPDVDFIIDIGGQDVKCFKIENDTVSDIFLNEACSSGCGSFLQTFAEARGEDIAAFSRLGLFAPAPVDLGSRCTVFMNSSVKQAQKDGASIENVSAGLSISVVKNAFYKVIRTTDPTRLGRNIVVQGGTFYNDAVLRAFEKELGFDVVRPNISGLMGAYGAALYGRNHVSPSAVSSVLTRQELCAFTHQVTTTNCALCTNRCSLTINDFSGGRRFIGGNKCDRPNQKGRKEPASAPLDLYAYKQQLLESYKPVPGPRGKIGLPLVLNLYDMLPFWHAMLTKLGFEVHTSPKSSRALYYSGQSTIPSDTMCYPAKLVHGHIRALCDREDIPAIFYPCMTYNFDEHLGDNHYNCPVVAYYPELLKANCRELEGKKFICEYFDPNKRRYFKKSVLRALKAAYPDIRRNEVSKAIDAGFLEYERAVSLVRDRAEEIITAARKEHRPIIVLAGRPYHADEEINHGLHSLIIRHGAAVISEESISYLTGKMPTSILNQWTFHSRMFSAARYIAKQSDMHMVQLVSFGCGLDAITTDEVRDILQQGGKLCTQIKIDEIVNLGSVNIRLRSLFATLEDQLSRKNVQGSKKEII